MDATIEAFLDGITPEIRRRDARTLIEPYTRVTGQEPALRGSIVGFGRYRASGPTGPVGHARSAHQRRPLPRRLPA